LVIPHHPLAGQHRQLDDNDRSGGDTDREQRLRHSDRYEFLIHVLTPELN
jgi:hypothetical protein